MENVIGAHSGDGDERDDSKPPAGAEDRSELTEDELDSVTGGVSLVWDADW